MRPLKWRQLGDILIRDKGIPEDVVRQALREQESSALRLGEILKQKGEATEILLAEALATQSGMEYVAEPKVKTSALHLLTTVPISYAKENLAVPLEIDGQTIRLAVADPSNNQILNDLSVLTGCRIIPCLAEPDRLIEAINQAYETLSGGGDSSISDIGEEDIELDGAEIEDLLDTSDEAPIIRFVNGLLTQAYRRRASDIHIEPFETEVVIRYRVDGLLYEVQRPPHRALANIISRLKIMANLDIAEKRLPQDGRFSVRIAGKQADIRVSTLPTAYGERVVLRLLDKSTGVLGLGDIGVDAEMLPQIKAMVQKNHGIFLVTGPTGAGKTTTLYSALSAINSHEQNIITIEDPIEYQLPGVGQIQVNSKINLTFAQGLRSILRQDPDVIMVGEIRDSETAKIAVQAALTGHLVFSTLHTNDSAGALARLVEMGVEPFLAASALIGVLAQRLVRTICPHCRVSYQPDEKLLTELFDQADIPKQATFYRGRGCSHCMQVGYLGRTGLYELLEVTDPIRHLVTDNADASSIRQQALKMGMRPLRQAGLAKVLSGETTVEEVLRVTQEEV
ncbi:type II secretion system protein E (GspE) [Desulfuromusa kysingii]|uniref:protein-secreting ATPase n=1 Tax=Desulfuromusa kysingii TaxID=37625 RepID=A0A1H3W4W4_9BACT|nr:type II secretion system ATPase GspE [Desulfuromusa kysingii]SDZ81308.1 type II secretion system protein E (GspE) [Desulfuromusa kysingii]